MNESLPPIAPAVPKSVLLIQAAKDRHKKELRMLRRLATILDKVPPAIADKAGVYLNQLDFNALTREEALAVITAVNAGKWNKSVNFSQPDTIDYQTEINGIVVRLWAAGPPETCRVVEVEEEVPATKIVRRKLICTGEASHE